jgi:phosphatidylglycerol:prolipoprotein diacylglycerol transferase
VIPYFVQPAVSIGPLTIHAFGVCAAAALLLGYFLVDRRAHRYALDPTRAGQVYLLIVVVGLLTGFLWNRMEGEPGISASGLGLGCLASAIPMAWIVRPRMVRPGKASFWNTLDLYAFAFPFVLAVARVGCFLAHDHIGNRTSSWIGVRFPGGTRFDLGLLYAMGAAVTAAVALGANRKRLPPGAVSLIVIAMLSVSRLATLPLGSAKAADYVIAILAPLFPGALWLLSRPSAFT